MSNTLDLNQRIVFAGLVRVSDDRTTLKDAFLHWNSSNSDSAIDIFEVVSMVDAYLGLGVAERKALMLGMHTASAKLFDELPPVPTYILGAGSAAPTTASEVSAEPAPGSASGKPAHIQITTRYLQIVSLNVQRVDASTHKELITAVADEGLGGLKAEVSAWAADNLNLIELGSSITIEQCQELAHEFYVLVCDFIGPVDTDVIVNRAITELSTSSQAREFNPQSLL